MAGRTISTSWLVLAVGLVCGCNALFGIEPAELDTRPSDAGAGAGGQGGDGSVAPDGAAGNAGGAADAGDASGGAGGDSGPCSPDLSKDANNCGSCGHSCLGAACANGKCQPEQVVVVTRNTNSLAIADNALFWVGSQDKELSRRDLATSKTDTYPLAEAASELAVSGSYAYLVEVGSDQILRASVAGETPSVVVDAALNIYAFDLDASDLYWVECPTDTTGQLFRSSPDGTGVTSLATVSVCADAVAVDKDYVYLAGVYSTSIWRVSRTQPIAGQVAVGSVDPGSNALAEDATHLYFAEADYANYAPGNVYRVKKSGGASETIATNQKVTTALLRVGNELYWTTQGTKWEFVDGSVMRATVTGTSVGQPEVVAENQGRPLALASDATHVYWACAGGDSVGVSPGSIWRVAR